MITLITIQETDTLYVVIALVAILVCWGLSKMFTNKNKHDK